MPLIADINCRLPMPIAICLGPNGRGEEYHAPIGRSGPSVGCCNAVIRSLPEAKRTLRDHPKPVVPDVVDGARSAASKCHRVVAPKHTTLRGAVHMQITTIGLDIAKNVFQVHGIDAAEKVVVRKQLRRSQVLAFFKALPLCLIGMEACATAHYWARELTKLGHRVRLMPAKDVKAYVKRNKNDAADAEAICEAVRRPTM